MSSPRKRRPSGYLSSPRKRGPSSHDAAQFCEAFAKLGIHRGVTPIWGLRVNGVWPVLLLEGCAPRRVSEDQLMRACVLIDKDRLWTTP